MNIKVVSLVSTSFNDSSNDKFLITIGNVYTAVATNDFNGVYYTILNDDNGKLCIFPKEWFDLLEDVRDKKLKQLLNE